MTYKFWIIGTNEEKDREHLTSLGVKVGKWEPDSYDEHPHATRGRGTFQDCEIDGDDLPKLWPLWAKRYTWGPMPGHDSTAHPMIAPKRHPNQHSAVVGVPDQPDSPEEEDEGL